MNGSRSHHEICLFEIKNEPPTPHDHARVAYRQTPSGMHDPLVGISKPPQLPNLESIRKNIQEVNEFDK